MSIARDKRRDQSGFTLLEIVLAVAILAMMSLAVYRFVQSNVTSLRLSAEANAADARWDGLNNLLTAQWQVLPTGLKALLGEPKKLNNRSRDEITWICSAGPGLLTRYAAGEFVVTMRLQPADKKSDRLDLGFVRKAKADSTITNEKESWVPLIEDVGSLQIRYFDPRLNTWLDKWADTVTLPRLVKITIARTDAAAPWEVIVPLGRTPL